MQIGTNYSLFAQSATPSASTGRSGASATSSGFGPSFGPAAQISISDQMPSFTGFTDYTQLGSSGAWQFDLAGVLTPPAITVPQQARSPEQQKADNAAIEQAQTLIGQGQYDDARTLMNDLLAQNHTNAAAVATLGSADLAEGKYASAEQLFLKAHAFDSTMGYDGNARDARILEADDATVLSRARGMLAVADQNASAVTLLTALTNRSPDNTAAHLLLGDTLLKNKDSLNGLLQYDSAIRSATPSELNAIAEKLGDLATSSPKSAFLRQLVGKVQIRQGHFEEALASLNAASQIAGDETGTERDVSAALIGLGRAQLGRGEVSEALSNLEQARKLAPTNPDARLALAEGYVAKAEKLASQRDYKSAAAKYRAVADLLKSDGTESATGTKANLRRRAAAGAFSTGRVLESRRAAAGAEIDGEVLAYQAAYDLDPTNTTYKRELANTRTAIGDELTASGDLKAAAYSYQRASDLFHGDATYKATTLAAFTRWGDEAAANLRYNDAVTAYRAAYEMDTSNQANKQNLAGAYNARGLDYYANLHLAQAATDFREALELFPDNPEYQRNYNLVRGSDPNGR